MVIGSVVSIDQKIDLNVIFLKQQLTKLLKNVNLLVVSGIHKWENKNKNHL